MKQASKNDERIDFVLTWVDGSDVSWQKEKSKYSGDKDYDKRVNAYRDWDILKYWFRGVEQNTPWVNKIYFVTYGHLPEWLNTECKKLEIVNHKDFIPKEHLPTFNSRAIEVNLYRIKGLSEQFSYFNDDMFIVRKMKPSDFFKNGKPRDRGVLTINIPKLSWQIQKINNNNLGVINEEFDFRKFLKRNIFKWINPIYGLDVLRTIWLLPCPRFPGIKHEHANGNFLKTTFKQIWEKYPNVMDETSKSKFRNQGTNVNQWIVKDWQIASGFFLPQRRNSLFLDLKFRQNFDKYIKYIKSRKSKIICINDADDLGEEEYQKKKKVLIEVFEEILPNKSSFEK